MTWTEMSRIPTTPHNYLQHSVRTKFTVILTVLNPVVSLKNFRFLKDAKELQCQVDSVSNGWMEPRSMILQIMAFRASAFYD
jgi:hypothetical protein